MGAVPVRPVGDRFGRRTPVLPTLRPLPLPLFLVFLADDIGDFVKPRLEVIALRFYFFDPFGFE